MDISVNNVVADSVVLQQAKVGQDAQMTLLKKALDLQSSATLQLIQSAMPTPQLATEGTLGTQVNTYA